MRSPKADRNKVPGFRLDAFELLNWGTFHQRAWRLPAAGENVLCTGDIGSGKSTLVDAITTLLVPAHRIVYNKAAGAENRERTLLSYIRGHYKSEKDDARLSARAVGLRGTDSFSVLLGVFRNEQLQEDLTLAQVFWCKEERGNPERLFVVAKVPLSIQEHFTRFGGEITDLKKRLRALPGVTLFDSFSTYGNEFRRRMGLAGEQALDLFYQTVSLKTVANITDFVRDHMLEPPDAAARIKSLCGHFENLNSAHEAVLRAKDQVARLAPLVEECDRSERVRETIGTFERLRAALPAYLARMKVGFLEEDLQRIGFELVRLKDGAGRQQDLLDGLYREVAETKQAILENGGRRLEEIRGRLLQEGDLRDQRKRRYEKDYLPACLALDFPRAQSLDGFHATRRESEKLDAGLGNDETMLRNEEVTLEVEIRNLDREGQGLAAEIASLRSRKTSIPSPMLALRQSLCQALGHAEAALPFAGELIQVRPEEQAWEGALERVLRSFGLSILVAEEDYPALVSFVDRNHLGERLVFFRIRREEPARRGRHVGDLALKLETRAGHRFQAWLDGELERRFDYVCCDSLEAFRREARALTRNGQTKGGDARHEKDDRHAIGDRTRYVLGWRNEEKIRALDAQLQSLHAGGLKRLEARDQLRIKLRFVGEQRQHIRDLQRFTEFTELDWQGPARRIQELNEEKAALEQGSDLLHELTRRLDALESKRQAASAEQQRLEREIGKRETQEGDAGQQREAAHALLATVPEPERDFCFPRLEAEPFDTQEPATARQCDEAETRMRGVLQGQIDARRKEAERLGIGIVRQMQSFRAAYPAECREADASPEAAPEYREMLERLRAEDLPRFETRFKQLLNEQAINEVALLQNTLEQEAEDIRDKIDQINTSLRQLDYNPGTFIQLQPEPNPDPEIRQFREDLRGCLADTLTGGEEAVYTERKFLQVKDLIDRFRGREGLAELDERWTRKVTDVRKWFIFSASERWQEDGAEREFFSDSSGKSGGQKEKLAYTILASALAYQYGIDQQARSARAFRFVMIDEAFGRGSDESTRYGLELFTKLGLQLLIVTPLQKIHIIEDYVRSVHLVHSSDGRESMLRSLTIEEYRAEKLQRQKLAAEAKA
ncbi:MAG: ATP-binding protein [Holophaga sp.]|nr:ATP-binding protein [Holophaga sp.]